METALDLFFEAVARKGLRVTPTGGCFDALAAKVYLTARGMMVPSSVFDLFSRQNGFRIFHSSGDEVLLGDGWFCEPFAFCQETFEKDCLALEEVAVPELSGDRDIRTYFPIFFDGFGGGLYCDATGVRGEVVFSYSADGYPVSIFVDLATALKCFAYAIEQELFFGRNQRLLRYADSDFDRFCQGQNLNMDYWRPASWWREKNRIEAEIHNKKIEES